MPQSNISAWLQFATQQMAAESYLDGIVGDEEMGTFIIFGECGWGVRG
jgi:hypothetical protein